MRLLRSSRSRSSNRAAGGEGADASVSPRRCAQVKGKGGQQDACNAAQVFVSLPSGPLLSHSETVGLSLSVLCCLPVRAFVRSQPPLLTGMWNAMAKSAAASGASSSAK